MFSEHLAHLRSSLCVSPKHVRPVRDQERNPYRSEFSSLCRTLQGQTNQRNAYKHLQATGNVGRLLIEPLAAHFNLTLLTRPSSAASLPSNLPTNVRTVSADYTIADLTIAFTGQDAVVSAVGAAAFASQKLLIDAAVAAGVRRFLPSEFSVNSDAKAVRELVPVFQAKDAVLQHLKAKENEGLTWTGLAVGPLLDWVCRRSPQPSIQSFTIRSADHIT